jgi:hypothetical protein
MAMVIIWFIMVKLRQYGKTTMVIYIYNGLIVFNNGDYRQHNGYSVCIIDTVEAL